MIRKADIARHWGCKPCYLSWLARNKAMPAFASLEEADAWRAQNAPPRVLRITTPPPPVAGKKIAGSEPPPQSHPIPPAPPAPAAQVSTVDTSLPAGVPPPPPDRAAIAAAVPDIAADADITSVYIAQAREVVAGAYRLYRQAIAGGSAAEVANALANWSAAIKATQSIIESAQAIREKSGTVIDIDINEDILGTVFQSWRHTLLKLGERVGARANPADPHLAVRVIDAAIDEAFRQFSAASAHALEEVKERAAAATAA